MVYTRKLKGPIVDISDKSPHNMRVTDASGMTIVVHKNQEEYSMLVNMIKRTRKTTLIAGVDTYTMPELLVDHPLVAPHLQGEQFTGTTKQLSELLSPFKDTPVAIIKDHIPKVVMKRYIEDGINPYTGLCTPNTSGSGSLSHSHSELSTQDYSCDLTDSWYSYDYSAESECQMAASSSCYNPMCEVTAFRAAGIRAQLAYCLPLGLHVAAFYPNYVVKDGAPCIAMPDRDGRPGMCIPICAKMFGKCGVECHKAHTNSARYKLAEAIIKEQDVACAPSHSVISARYCMNFDCYLGKSSGEGCPREGCVFNHLPDEYLVAYYILPEKHKKHIRDPKQLTRQDRDYLLANYLGNGRFTETCLAKLKAGTICAKFQGSGSSSSRRSRKNAAGNQRR